MRRCNTAIGRRLLPDETGNVAGLANHKPWELHAWAEFGHSLRTGEPASRTYYGDSYFDWLGAHPVVAAQFNHGMRRRTTMFLAQGLDSFEWPATGVVVDVGGGNGQLLAAVLERRPGLRGVLFDFPQGLEEARDLLSRHGVAHRVEIVSGSFFDHVPPGHDGYVLASILHDWSDECAGQILPVCARR